MMNTINRGSEWRKWDLHIHSFETKMNNQFGDDFDIYLQTIEHSDISVFGITDYFNVDTQLNTINKFHDKFPESSKTFFVNVEFRLNENVSNDSAGHVNVHLIFDNQIEESKIRNFISSLELTQTKSNGTHKKIVDLQKEVDYQSATIDHNELIQKLKAFFGNEKPYLIVFAAGGHGGIRPNICGDGSNGSLRNGPLSDELDKISNFLFGDLQYKDYFLNRKKQANGTYCKSLRYEGAQDKAVIKESDAHMLEKNGQTNGIGDGYCWIKADTTFEGLRQILFEPENRVAICRDKPEPKSPYLVIDHVTFNEKGDDKNEIESVYLNPNLNTVIGGRSNGKSTFTNSIAKALKNPHFQPLSSSGKVMNSFSDADFKVYWQDKDDFDNDRPIEFIPQDYMITLAENDKARNKLIRSTIETDKDNYDLIQDYEQKAQSNQSNVRQLLDDLELINKQLSELKAPEGDKPGITSQLDRIHELVKEQSDEADFSREDQEAYIYAYENCKIWENKRRLSEENLHHISGLKGTSIKLNVDLTQTDDSIYNNKILNIINNLTEEVNEKWKARIDTLEVEQRSNLAEQQKKVNDIIKSSSYVNGQEHIKNNQVLKSLSEQQKIEMTKLEAFKEFEKNKENLEKQKQEKQAQILDEYSKFTKFQDDLKSNFKAKPNNGDIEIAIEFVDIPFENNIQYLRSNNADNMKFIHDFNQNRISVINNIFGNSDLILNQGKTIDELRRDIFSQKWNTLSYVLKYENDDYLQMSQGKKAFVILTLILEFSRDKKPVIIDQPEDSLDNRSIYRELTKYLKTKKKERQIILVTHNPNVVVGADAENVIVANQNSSNEPNKNRVQFSYVNGALENTFDNESALAILDKKGIREHAIEILEGGKEAFRERENKYTSEASS